MTLLHSGDSDLLMDTPVGRALYRTIDATTAYASSDEDFGNAVCDELASSAITLCEVILDLLAELKITE